MLLARFEGQSASVRFLLLLLAEAAMGASVYTLFTFVPTAAQVPITLAAWAILFYDNTLHPQKNKSLGSLLCAVTSIPVCACGIAWRVTHQDVWSRLALTGACLMATLILLDRRRDWGG